MKKLFNFRPAVILLVFYSLGILIGFFSVKYGKTVAVIFFTALFLFALVLLISKYIEAAAKLYNYIKSCRIFLLINTLICFAAFLYYNLSAVSFDNKGKAFDGKTVAVSGDISQSRSGENGSYFIVDDAVFTADNNKFYVGRIFVYVYKAEIESEGYITFEGRANSNKIFQGGKINSYAYRNNIHYSFFIPENGYQVSAGGGNAVLKVRKHIRKILYNNMRSDNTDISYALITGDSLSIEQDIRRDFSDSGIAHILCVSGLHVGVLSAAAIYLLTALKLNKKAQIPVISALLLFYGGICGFAPSVIRAIVMTEVYLFSKAIGAKYDMLSCVSFAALVILAVFPLMIFDAGFQLSFLAVLGITLLYRRIDKLLGFIPAKLRAALCVTVSAQAGVLPITALYYKNMPLLSVLVNLLTVPLVSFIYIFLLIFIVIMSVLPIMSFLFFLPQGMLELIKYIASFAASLEAAIYLNGIGAGLAAFYFVLITISGYVFLKKKTKTVLSISLCALVIISAAIYNAPFNYGGTSVSATGISCSSLITADKKVYYINYGGREDIIKLKEHLRQSNINNIECAFFADCNNAASVVPHLKNYNIQKYIMRYSDKYQNTFRDLD